MQQDGLQFRKLISFEGICTSIIPKSYQQSGCGSVMKSPLYALSGTSRPRLSSYWPGGAGPADRVLELGCGYGRVLQRLAAKAKTLVGIDTARDSLLMARRIFGNDQSCFLLEMNAVDLGLRTDQFDMVVCVQNGVAVFHVDQRNLFEEAIRVTRSGGVVLFSSYSEAFWEERLDWFQIQAEHGLVGEIDYDATGHGVIVCKDGFRAATVSPEEFVSLAANFEIDSKITEVDGSSVFCELHVR